METTCFPLVSKRTVSERHPQSHVFCCLYRRLYGTAYALKPRSRLLQLVTRFLRNLLLLVYFSQDVTLERVNISRRAGSSLQYAMSLKTLRKSRRWWLPQLTFTLWKTRSWHPQRGAPWCSHTLHVIYSTFLYSARKKEGWRYAPPRCAGAQAAKPTGTREWSWPIPIAHIAAVPEGSQLLAAPVFTG